MGVLVGTSLIVIIPEGVETLYSSTTVGTHVHRRDITTRGIDVRWEHAPRSVVLEGEKTDDSESPSVADIHRLYTRSDDERPAEEMDENEKEEEENHTEQRSPHAWIGVGLISGFLLMYLIDQVPQFATTSASQQPRTYHISLDNLSSGLERGPSPSRTGFLGMNAGNSGRDRGFATTTGLVIHAAADGIALGASSSNTGLSFIIFIAIMVHKAPASFGLTTVLLRQGLSTRAARAHLLIFSLAAPVGAFLTWLVAHTVMAGHVGDGQGTRWMTGMLLLFSAGTFL